MSAPNDRWFAVLTTLRGDCLAVFRQFFHARDYVAATDLGDVRIVECAEPVIPALFEKKKCEACDGKGEVYR